MQKLDRNDGWKFFSAKKRTKFYILFGIIINLVLQFLANEIFYGVFVGWNIFSEYNSNCRAWVNGNAKRG